MFKKMSRIEDLLMEAWDLGIKDQVMERVTQKQRDLQMAGKWMDREVIYDQAMEEVKKEMTKKNGSRN
jgi:hypothetical protein